MFCLKSVVASGTVAAAAFFGFSDAAASAEGSRWTGAYAGISIGYGWDKSDPNFTSNDPAMTFALVGLAKAPITGLSADSSGVLGGLTAGYNWQVDRSWVIGLEADFNWADLHLNEAVTQPFFGAQTSTVSITRDINWFGTLRGRLGWLPTEALLLYATGGLAYGRVAQSAELSHSTFPFAPATGGFSFVCPAANVACVAGSSSRIGVGWTLGGGAEYALTSSISLKAEYLYVNLGSDSVTSTALATVAAHPNRSSFMAQFGDAEVHTVKAGLNFKF